MIPEKYKFKEDRDYIGLNMGKTHSQEEYNKEIQEYNERILRDCGIREEIIGLFDCWKGTCFLKSKEGLEIGTFEGGTTEEILTILKRISDYFDYEEMMKEGYENIQEDVFRLVTTQQRYEILKRQNWKCNLCSKRLKFNSKSNWEGEVAHIDHIHPYSKREKYPNGMENINEISNLQALCPDCNFKKGDKECQ